MCATCFEKFKEWCGRASTLPRHLTHNPVYEDDDVPLLAETPSKTWSECFAAAKISVSDTGTYAVAGLCSFAQLAALRATNTNLCYSLYISSSLYTFFRTFIPDLDIKQCGIEEQTFTAFNTMWFTISTLLLWLACLPLQKKYIAAGLKNKDILFAKDYKWMKELENSMMDTLCSLGFVSYLADRFRRNHSSVKIVLYSICCRGIAKGLVLILGETFVKKNQRWILQRFEELVLDNTFVRAINGGVAFSASLTCAVVTAINYIVNARQQGTYAREQDDAFWAAIVGFGVGASITLLDSLYKTDFSSGYPRRVTGMGEPKGWEKSMSFLEASGMCCNLFYYVVNIVVSVAMCAEGEPLSPEIFQASAVKMDASLGIMMILGGVSIITAARYPAAPLLAPPFKWPHESSASIAQKLNNFATPFRYALTTAFGATLVIDKIPSRELDRVLKSINTLLATDLWCEQEGRAEISDV